MITRPTTAKGSIALAQQPNADLPASRERTVDMEAIAKRLGVSKTTVHYALAKKGRVSTAVRERVLEVAEEMGYRPNLLARSLRTKQTQTLGVILSSLTSSFHAHLLETIDQAAQQSGYSILLACSYRDVAKEQELAEILLRKGVDGMIVAPLGTEGERSHYRRLTEEGAAIVFVDRDIPDSSVDSVAVDNFLGGRLAGQHLIESGRTKAAFVTMLNHGRQSQTLQARHEGLNYALQSKGLRPAPALGLDTVGLATGEMFGHASVTAAIRNKSFSFDSLFCGNDNLAYGAIHALQEAGYRVPADVAVVGFDDQDTCAFFNPPLSTVRQPVLSVGSCAVELLLKRMRDPEHASRERQRIKIEPHLIKRDST